MLFIEHKDAIECFKQYANPKSLIYCDPPYVLGTRVVLETYKIPAFAGVTQTCSHQFLIRSIHFLRAILQSAESMPKD